tara:strand:- start:535 stop:2100 length:1566 start_codon:yes stop_codon:yes gene_type:complete
MVTFTAIVYDFSDKKLEYLKTRFKLRAFKNLKVVKINFKKNYNLSDISSDYVFFIRSGDFLSKNTSNLLLDAIKNNPDLIYTDEAIIGNKISRLNFYKPDYSKDMLLSINYFRNLLVIKNDILQKIKIIKKNDDKTFFYDLILKVISISQNIYHIPEVLYFSKVDKKQVSYSDFYQDFDQIAGEKDLTTYCIENNFFDETVKSGLFHGTYRVQRQIKGNPLVSIIIPFRDQHELLDKCINSILSKSSYNNYEIIGINNGSEEKKTIELMKLLESSSSNISFYDCDIPFNYSKLNNIGVNKYSKGEYIVLLNNDTKVISENWIESLLEHAQRPDVGVVGAKLLYPDNTIQHAGIITTLHNNYTGHIFRNLPDEQPGYFFMPNVIRNYNALTFACVMINRENFNKLDGLDEELLVAYNDIDFCLRARKLGLLNIYTPYAKLYHYESKSRGVNDTDEKKNLAKKERDITIAKHPEYFAKDIYFNENLSTLSDECTEKSPAPILVLLYIKILRKLKNICYTSVLE